MANFKEYSQFDALGLAELVRTGETTPQELLAAAIREIEALNPQLNAVIHLMFDAARRQVEAGLPDGPFRGVPFLLKDLLASLAGHPLGNGSRFFADYRPVDDSEMVRRYRAAGLVFVGKTNTPEFGIMGSTEPEAYGPTRNPWNLAYTAGGSSGGSAAAVAARMVPAAHGGDGLGSIRIPSSCCGLFGLMPTRGRNPMGPERSEAWQGFVREHVLTRTVRDSAAMLDATAGADLGVAYVAPAQERPFLEEVGRDPGRLRIAFSSKPLITGQVDGECRKAVEEAAALCASLGHDVEEVDPPFEGLPFASAILTMLCGEIRADIRAGERLLGRQARESSFEAITWGLGMLGDKFSATDFVEAVRFMRQAGRGLQSSLSAYDLFLTPTLATAPVKLGALHPQGAEAAALDLLCRLNAGGLFRRFGNIDELAAKSYEFTPFTPPFNATGQPAMSVPLYWSADGLPVGVQFVAHFGDEATLFRLAAQLEEARSWVDKAPPLVAAIEA